VSLVWQLTKVRVPTLREALTASPFPQQIRPRLSHISTLDGVTRWEGEI